MNTAYKIAIDKSFIELVNNRSSLNAKLFNILPHLKKMLKSTSLGSPKLHADTIWNEWFPEMKADIFISHSSKDAEIAKKFSVWLKECFNLTAFIDSEIWGHSDDLLMSIDKDYCYNHATELFDYHSRNGSSAHVHMILSYSLTRMIDKTECFIFLDSDNSVTVEDSIEGTFSPWIFHELATVDTIKLKPKRLMSKVALFEEKALTKTAELKIKYPLLGDRLLELPSKTLKQWYYNNRLLIDTHKHPLDILENLVVDD